MNISARDATIVAVSYADIFDYPLTQEELGVWVPFLKLKRSHLVERQQGETLKKLRLGNITYYSLRPVKRLVAIRHKRTAWSEKKWIRARRVAGLLRLIPTITLVGVTGGLTRSNARQEDDIDFLIITAPKTLWVTRALTTIFLDLLRLRRRPGDREFRNLICLNMFMSEDGLALPRKERDLFTAHEVLLMTPLWERGGPYARFFKANRWVRRFLPNAWRAISNKQKAIGENQNYRPVVFSISYRLSRIAHHFFEPLAKSFQLWYMRHRRSTEIVTDNVIRFHPRDARGWIKSALGRRLSRHKIPLDKIFYGR